MTDSIVALPNFFIIGAPKSGTTTLYDLLCRHPDIYLPAVKEPGFFSSESQFELGIDYYARTFFRGAFGHSARGEATPWYLYHPDVPERIAMSIPSDNLRFVAILRDPVARAYSMYWDQVARGTEVLTFPDALAAERVRQDSGSFLGNEYAFRYVFCGHYSDPLKRYISKFGRDRVFVLLQDDLRSDPNSVLCSVQRFLGVEEIGLAGPELKSNQVGMPRSRLVQRALLAVDAAPLWARAAVRRVVSPRLYRPLLDNVSARNRVAALRPPIDPSTEAALRTYFLAEIDELEHLVGRDLSLWREGGA